MFFITYVKNDIKHHTLQFDDKEAAMKFVYNLRDNGASNIFMRTIPTPLSRVIFDFDSVPAEHHSNYPFKKNKLYIFLGEIVGMEGHCVVVEQASGQIYAGYHSDNFIEFEED